MRLRRPILPVYKLGQTPFRSTSLSSSCLFASLSLELLLLLLLFAAWVLIRPGFKFSVDGAVMRNRDSHAPLWWCLHQSVLINFSQPIFYLSSFLCFLSFCCCIYLGKFLLFFQFVFTSLFSGQSSGSFIFYRFLKMMMIIIIYF